MTYCDSPAVQSPPPVVPGIVAGSHGPSRPAAARVNNHRQYYSSLSLGLIILSQPEVTRDPPWLHNRGVGIMIGVTAASVHLADAAASGPCGAGPRRLRPSALQGFKRDSVRSCRGCDPVLICTLSTMIGQSSKAWILSSTRRLAPNIASIAFAQVLALATP